MLIGNELTNKMGVRSLISPEMERAIELWARLYEGKAPWLAKQDEKGEVKSLNLPVAVASELARLTTLELKTEISGSSRAEFLNASYQFFLDDIRLWTELACAKSGVVFKPYVADGAIYVSCVQAGSFFPTAFDSSGRMSGCVFADRIVRGEWFYTRLEYHEAASRYKIINRAYVSRNAAELGRSVALADVPEWAEIQPEIYIDGVRQPLYGYFKMPMANTLDPLSPLGVSAYSRAVSLFEQADKQYSRLLWEFESGERALYVHDTAFKKDAKGRLELPDKRLYRTIATLGDNDLFEDFTPTLRDASIMNGLNAILRRVEYNCGLAYGTLSDVQDTDKTAEEIKASKQRSYATVCDIQRALRSALSDLVYGMDALCSLYRLAPAGRYDISFDFDDSIVADRQAEFLEKQQLVTAGIMQPWEFRAWYFGETDAEAKRALGTVEIDSDDDDRFRIDNA